MTQQQNFYIVTGILVLVALGGGFYGGMQYQKNQRTAAFTSGAFGQRAGQFRGATGFGGTRGGNGNGFRPVSGEILSFDNNSITVKLADGSSKIILLSNKTVINKASQGTKEELTQGTKVAVFGSEETNGSIMAQNIQINPMERMVGGTPAPTDNK